MQREQTLSMSQDPGRAMTTGRPSASVAEMPNGDSGLMNGVRNTEEMIKMKVRLLAMAFGFILAAGGAWAGPTPGGPDTDCDGVENAFDNCVNTPNANQNDTDHNACGDACTQNIACDFNADTTVGAPDFLTLGMNFNMNVPTGTNGDCAPGGGDGVVGAPDFLLLGMNFNHTVGPSGITNAQCTPSTCRCTPQ
jgi:hypothetical protein